MNLHWTDTQVPALVNVQLYQPMQPTDFCTAQVGALGATEASL